MLQSPRRKWKRAREEKGQGSLEQRGWRGPRRPSPRRRAARCPATWQRPTPVSTRLPPACPPCLSACLPVHLQASPLGLPARKPCSYPLSAAVLPVLRGSVLLKFRWLVVRVGRAQPLATSSSLLSTTFPSTVLSGCAPALQPPTCWPASCSRRWPSSGRASCCKPPPCPACHSWCWKVGGWGQCNPRTGGGLLHAACPARAQLQFASTGPTTYLLAPSLPMHSVQVRTLSPQCLAST